MMADDGTPIMHHVSWPHDFKCRLGCCIKASARRSVSSAGLTNPHHTHTTHLIAARFPHIQILLYLQTIMVKLIAITAIAVTLLSSSVAAQQPADSYLALREHFETQLGRELDPFEARDVAYLAERGWKEYVSHSVVGCTVS